MNLIQQADRTANRPAFLSRVDQRLPLFFWLFLVTLSPWLFMGQARANPADLFGIGAREASMGNAFTAVADDPFAAYYNLGGLTQLKRTTLSIGLQIGRTALGDPSLCQNQDGVGCSEPFYYTEAGVLTTQQKRYGYEQPHGVAFGLALPLIKHLNLGLAAYLPVDVRYDEEGRLSGVGIRLARFQTTDPYLPDYILYQNRTQRFAMYSGLSYEVIPGLGLGLGITMLAGSQMELDFKGTLEVAEGPPDEDGNPTTVATMQTVPQISMGLATSPSPLLGVMWDLGTVSEKMANWQVGAAFRGESKMTANADINADLSLSAELAEGEDPASYGTTISGISTEVVGFFTPRQASLGVSGVFIDRIRVAADLTWVNWSAFVPSMASLPDSVRMILGMELQLESGREVDTSGFRDIVVPRLGLEGRLGSYETGTRLKGMDVYLRAGAAYEKNPFPRQTLLTNLLNSDRLITTAGAGVTTHNPLSAGGNLPMSMDLSLQYHYLWPTTHEKAFDPGGDYPDGYPVDGSYTSRGAVLQGAITFQFGF